MAVDKVCFLLMLILGLAKSQEISEARDGTLTLSGDNNNYWQSAAILVPILIIIIVLDFAIFGTFASRSDQLNPISSFFFHARNGLQSLRNRRRHQYQQQYVRQHRSFKTIVWQHYH